MGVLLRRMLLDLQASHMGVARPFRVKRTSVVRPQELERAVTQAAKRPGATSILVLLDADKDCPAKLAAELLPRCERTIELPVAVVLAKVETEAWILAAVESVRGVRGIRGDAEPPADPEGVRDAKGVISSLMEGSRGYLATDDQPALLAQLDLALAAERSPSFEKLKRDLVRLAG